jgi:hypothetical protein
MAADDDATAQTAPHQLTEQGTLSQAPEPFETSHPASVLPAVVEAHDTVLVAGQPSQWVKKN